MRQICLVVAVLLSCEALAGQTGRLQLSVGGTSVQSRVSIIDLGLGVQGEREAFEVVVKNLLPRSAEMDAFSFQDNLTVRWKTAQPKTGLWTRHTFGPGEEYQLEGEVLYDDSSEVPQVSLMEKGAEISHFAVEYILTTKRQIPETVVSQTLPSGLGEWWSSWYRICLGPAPVGYKLDSVPILEVKQFASGQPHPRSCGAWAQCKIAQANDDNVCGEFTVQGHHQAQSLTDNARDEIVWVTGSLTATYSVSLAKPRILEVKEVAGQRR